MGVARIGPFHRVAQEHEQFHPRQVAGDPLRGQRVEHVVGARLEGHRARPRRARGQPGGRPEREMAPVPGQPAIVGPVEVVHFQVHRGAEHRRVLAERTGHRGGAAPLAADDQEAGQHPGRGRRHTGEHQGRAPGPPGR